MREIVIQLTNCTVTVSRLVSSRLISSFIFLVSAFSDYVPACFTWMLNSAALFQAIV
jgi:hypothetical protein